MRTVKPLMNILLLGAMLAVINLSCKKVDDLSKKELLVYAAPGSSAYNVINGNMVLMRNKVLSEDGTSFPVMLTRSFNKDIEVTARIDTSLVRVYDSLYRTSSPSLPKGAFGLVKNGKVTIKAGDIKSTDSLGVHTLDAGNVPPGTTTYVVPIVLSSASNDIPVSNTRQVMYAKLTVTSIAVSINSLKGTKSVSILLKRENGINTGEDIIYLRSQLNKAVQKAITTNVQVNTNLVQARNAAEGTNYKAFPPGSWKLEKASSTIPTNATLSSDSVCIKLTDLSLFSPGTDYLLPVELIDDNTPENPSADTKAVYIDLRIFVNNVDPSNSGLTGTTMNRTGWSVTTAGGDYSNPSLVLDGDNKTAWDSDGKLPAWIALNMGTTNIVKGFSIVPNYEYIEDDFINMDVLSSNNGITWKLEGYYVGTAPSPSSSATNPDIKTIKFVTPVTARYFKFSVTKTSPGNGNYTGMAELNAIQ